MSGEAGEELTSPAAAVMARRESHAAVPKRLKVAAREDTSDEEWDADEDGGEEHYGEEDCEAEVDSYDVQISQMAAQSCQYFRSTRIQLTKLGISSHVLRPTRAATPQVVVRRGFVASGQYRYLLDEQCTLSSLVGAGDGYLPEPLDLDAISNHWKGRPVSGPLFRPAPLASSWAPGSGTHTLTAAGVCATQLCLMCILQTRGVDTVPRLVFHE